MSNFEVPDPSYDFRAPYPVDYQTKAFTRDGLPITIRPIKPEDAPLLVQSFKELSKRSIFFRFLGLVKELPPKWIKSFTCIDYTRDVALVAIQETESRERILGVCRIVRDPRDAETTKGEFAIVVEDAWQGKGIGNLLAKHSISIARKLGIKSIWGIVSSENDKMLSMAKQLVFSVELDAEACVYEISMQLCSDD